MFDLGDFGDPEAAAAPVTTRDIHTWTTLLATTTGPTNDPERVEALRRLEELKCAAEALQAVITADLDTSQRAVQATAGIPAARQGRGIAAQVALARRESPHRGQRHLGLAKILRDELPHTMAAFRAGRITEWKATLLARETACLALADRRTVDVELAADPTRLEQLGDAELEAAAKKLAYRLDPASYLERRRRAETDRRVTLRPAPEVMTQLTALLPVKTGVAVYAALTKAADTAAAAGDARTRGQVMADTLVDRILTGTTGVEGSGARPGVMVDLVVSDHTLYGTSDDPGRVDGYGPVPADLARELATGDRVWLRRLYTAPTTGHLVAIDARARVFPAGLARLIRLRDQRCRTPWCDAPIRHADHVTPAADGGSTTATNAQGLCQACNHAKQAIGWHARPRPGPAHTIDTRTPTGHTYTTTAPELVTPTWTEAEPGRWTLTA